MSREPGADAAGVPGVIAHRGFAARYPENTLPALDAALALGADGVEFDVQFTRDAQPVVLHDETLHRTGGHPGRISELTRVEALSLSVGEPARLGGVLCQTGAQGRQQFPDHCLRLALVESEFARDGLVGARAAKHVHQIHG